MPPASCLKAGLGRIKLSLLGEARVDVADKCLSICTYVPSTKKHVHSCFIGYSKY